MRLVEWLRDRPGVRYALATLVVVPTLAAAVLLTALGHCSSFGGRCPSDPVPLWENDVFGFATLSIGTAVATVVLAAQPTRQGLLRALGAGVVFGVLAGLLAASWAAG